MAERHRERLARRWRRCAAYADSRMASELARNRKAHSGLSSLNLAAK